MSALMRAIRNFGQASEREVAWPQLSLEEYANFFTFNGMQYPFVGSGSLAQERETPPSDFVGYVQQLYKSNGVVFACMAARQRVFSQARFQFQRMNSGTPGDLFGTPELAILEQPWGPTSTTSDLLGRMGQDADLGGNGFIARLPPAKPGQKPRLTHCRPDWVTIVAGSQRYPNAKNPNWMIDAEVIGYIYQPGGPAGGEEPEVIFPQNMAHFAPHADPTANFIGMSWLTPVVREILGDKAAMQHKLKFFENGASPNLVVSMASDVTPEGFAKFVELFEAENRGVANAYKTLFFGGGSNVQVIGANMRQLDFKVTQGHGETRIAAAAGVPPIIVGLSEGLEASTYCLPFDGRVWTPSGLRPIGAMRPGDEVWTHLDGRLARRRVTWQGRVGEKLVYTLRTKNRTLRATGNHPVLVRVPGRKEGANGERSASVAWRRVDEIQPGDYVVERCGLPDQGGKHLPTGQPATVEIMQWLGAYTGDGCTMGDTGITMCMPLADRTAAFYSRIPPRHFTKARSGSHLNPSRRAADGLTPQMVALRKQGLSYPAIAKALNTTLHPMSIRDRITMATRSYTPIREPVVVRSGPRVFRFSSREAVAWHRRMGVTGTARTKRVPAWIYGLSEELRLAYLAGLVDSDGYIDRRGAIRFQFANRELVEDVRFLMLSCGIECCNIARSVFAAACLPQLGRQSEYEAWHFCASSAVDAARIPFADPVYRERVECNSHRRRPGGKDAARAGLEAGFGFVKVRSVEVGPSEPVYDIEVNDGHSFIADGVVVHNSNYSQARRAFADGTLTHLWGNAAGSLQTLVDMNKLPGQGGNVRLWYDSRHIPFLKADAKDDAEVQTMKAATINTLITAGYKPDAVVAAVEAGDLSMLAGEHSGLMSVQLMPPGADKSSSNGNGNGNSPAALSA